MGEVRRRAYLAHTKTTGKFFLPSTGLIHRGVSQTLPYPSIAHQRIGLGTAGFPYLGPLLIEQSMFETPSCPRVDSCSSPRFWLIAQSMAQGNR